MLVVRGCSMIEMIGLTTLCMLVWVLASSMATESAAEKRRVAMLSAGDLCLNP